MRQERIAKVLRLGGEPGAVVDERPAVRRELRWYVLVAAVSFTLGAALALLWAWHEWKNTIRTPGIESTR